VPLSRNITRLKFVALISSIKIRGHALRTMNLFSAQVADFLLTVKIDRKPFPAYFSENNITLMPCDFIFTFFENW